MHWALAFNSYLPTQRQFYVCKVCKEQIIKLKAVTFTLHYAQYQTLMTRKKHNNFLLHPTQSVPLIIFSCTAMLN